MKTRKILSVLLAVAMLFSVMSISVSAAEKSYDASASYSISGASSVNRDTFAVSVDIDESKIGVLDGGSAEVSYEIKSILANGVDYITAPDDFFAVFTAEDFEGADLVVNFTITVPDSRAFGTLEYVVNVDGFSAPLSFGLAPIDDLLAGIALPVDISIDGAADNFVSVAGISVEKAPARADYYDTEEFDLSGTTVLVALSNGETGTYTFSDNQTMFSCSPAIGTQLTCDDTMVTTYFDGIEIARTPIQVSHKMSAGYVNITTNKYLETNPGYHALVCEGCGYTTEALPHNPSPILDENGNEVLDEEGNVVCWVSNGDQSFTSNGTESSICSDCGTVLVRDAFGTADYNDAFANYHFIKVVFDYINTLLRFIGAATD